MIKDILRFSFKILPKRLAVSLSRDINGKLRDLAYFGHALQMENEWVREPVPEWIDHYLDLYYYWHKKRNPLWVERGIFNLLALKEGAKVLDICCGDGFNSSLFYSIRASEIIAVDFNEDAINFAKKFHATQNVEFKLGDIREKFPQGKFDNIIWDAAIEHFTPLEINQIMKLVKRHLKPRGTLSGYTILQLAPQSKQHNLHEYEFTSADDLKRFLTPYFKNVRVFKTEYPNRKNIYFYASDGQIPFDETWQK